MIVRIRRARDDFRSRGGWETVIEVDDSFGDAATIAKRLKLQRAKVKNGEVVIDVA